MMKLVSKIDKKKIKITIYFFIALIIFNLILIWFINDESIVNVYYRAKINGKYTSWSKNGKSVNSNNKVISDLDIKLDNNKDGKVFYEITDENGEFKNGYYNDFDNGLKKLDGTVAIRMYLTKSLKKKYDVCYRTYNKKDKWLDWACEGEISGNKKYKIENIKIKIIPKNVLRNEYLDDYLKDIKGKSKGFKE